MATWIGLMMGAGSFVLVAPFLIGVEPVEHSRSVELRRALSGGSNPLPVREILRDSWSTDPAQSVAWDQRLNRGTIDLVGAVQQGDWSYVDILADLQDPAFVSEGRLGCGDQYAEAIETACSYRIEMVLQRVDETTGRLVYTRVIPHERHLLDNELVDPNCEAFVMCLAGVRLGQIVSMPPGKQQLEVSQELYSPWADPRLYDVEFVERLADDYRHHVQSYGESPSFETPLDAVEYRFFVDIVPYLESLQHELGKGMRQ